MKKIHATGKIRRLLLEQVVPHNKTLVASFVLMVSASCLSLVNPWLAGNFTQALLQQDAPIAFSWQQILVIWVGVLVLQALLNFGNQYLTSVTSEKILTGLRIRIYDHIQALPLVYFTERKLGQVLALLTYDADIVSNFVTGTLLSILPELLVLIGALVIVFLINPQIALLLAVLVPVFYVLMRLIGRRIRPLSREINEAYADTFAIAEENLQLLPVIKSFTRESIESGRFSKSNKHMLHLLSKYLGIQSMLSPTGQLIASLGVLLLLFLSSSDLVSGKLTTAEFVSLIFYCMLFVRPVSSLSGVYGQIQHALAAVERIGEMITLDTEPLADGKPALENVKGRIEFNDIHFSYPDRKKVINGLDLVIEAGETVAITGRNGAGKSTLIHLLQRFRDVDAGNILIDGIDITSVNLRSLRAQIGLVQQNILLMNASIRENIQYGKPGADDHTIEQAARAANAYELIESLPDGLDTLIGDQGIKLSGGQKQRIALARALIKDPAILILDEATAMFDPEAEETFVDNCHEYMQRRTVIIITHKPTSLAIADRILVMEDGKIDRE